MGDREIPVANRVLARRWGSYTAALHRFNLQTSRPAIDDSLPPAALVDLPNSRRFDPRVQYKCTQIEHENHLLLTKMRSIMASSGQPQLQAEPFYKPSLNREFRKKELNRIMNDNQRLLRTIESLPSVYDHSKLHLEQKEREKILNNISRFRNGKKSKKSNESQNEGIIHILNEKQNNFDNSINSNKNSNTDAATPIGFHINFNTGKFQTTEFRPITAPQNNGNQIRVPMSLNGKRSIPLTARPPTYHRPRPILAPPPKFDSLYATALAANESHTTISESGEDTARSQSSGPNSARRPARPAADRDSRQPQSARAPTENREGICVFRRSGLTINQLDNCSVSVFEKPAPFRFDLFIVHSAHRIVPSPLVLWFSQLRQEVDYGTGLTLSLLQPENTEFLILHYILPRILLSGAGDWRNSVGRQQEIQCRYDAFKILESEKEEEKQADDASHEELLAEARKAEQAARAEKEKAKQKLIKEKQAEKQQKENEKKEAAKAEAAEAAKARAEKQKEKEAATPRAKNIINGPATAKVEKETQKPKAQSPSKPKPKQITEKVATSEAEPVAIASVPAVESEPGAATTTDAESESKSKSRPASARLAPSSRPFTPQANTDPILHCDQVISTVPFSLDFAHNPSTLFIKLYCRSMQFLHLFQLSKGEINQLLSVQFTAGREIDICRLLIPLFEIQFQTNENGENVKTRESMKLFFNGKPATANHEETKSNEIAAAEENIQPTQSEPVEPAKPAETQRVLIVENNSAADKPAASNAKSDKNSPRNVNFSLPSAAPGTIVSTLNENSVFTLMFKISLENLPLPHAVDSNTLNPMAALYVQASEDQPFSFVCQTERQSSTHTASGTAIPSGSDLDRFRHPKFIRPLIIPNSKPDDREYMITVYNARQEQNLTEADILGSCIVEQRRILEALKDIRIEDSKRKFGDWKKIPLQANGVDMENCFVNLTNIHFTVDEAKKPENKPIQPTKPTQPAKDNLTASNSLSSTGVHQESGRTLALSPSISTYSSPSASTDSLLDPVTAAVSNRGSTGIEVRGFRFPSGDHIAAIYYRLSQNEQFQYLIQSDRITASNSPTFSPILSIDNSKCFNAELMVGFYSLNPNDQHITAQHLFGSALFTLHELLVAKHMKLRLIHENRQVPDSYVVLKGISTAASTVGIEAGPADSTAVTSVDVELSAFGLQRLPNKLGVHVKTPPDTMIALYALQAESGQFCYLAQTERIKHCEDPAYRTKIRLPAADENQQTIFSVYDVTSGRNITEEQQIGTVAISLKELIQAGKENRELKCKIVKENEELESTLMMKISVNKGNSIQKSPKK